MSGVNIPTDSTHLSEFTDMIDQYGGLVDSQFAKSSIMRPFVDMQTIRGGDTKIVRRMSKTTLQTLTAGVRPAAHNVSFGKVGVTVDTVVLARANRGLLNEFQTDFNARAEIAMDHGKEIGKFFDESLLIRAIKGAGETATVAGQNPLTMAGTTRTLSTATAHTDPELLYRAIVEIIVRMEEQDIDPEEGRFFLRPTQMEILSNHPKLVNKDFTSGNGDFAKGTVAMIRDVPLFKTARIPRAAIAGHFLSNAENNFGYDVSAQEARAVAVYLHPKSMLAGETIPLTSTVFWSDVEKQWFIDSWLAYGVSTRRPDLCGCVFANAGATL